MDQDKIKEFIDLLEEALEIPRGSLNDNNYNVDFDWDSLATLSTLATIDTLFDVVISPDDLNNCKQLKSILELIEKALEINN